MEITIPEDAGALARSQAAASGFPSVSEYVVSLIRRQHGKSGSNMTRADALDDLRRLRAEIQKLSTDEIVEAVREARADLS